MKHVSAIGVLILGFFPLFPFAPSAGRLLTMFFLINPFDCGLFLYPHLFTSPLLSYLNTMSAPASSYIQVGLNNLEYPLNHSPSPHAQVRGFDWSLILVD